MKNLFTSKKTINILKHLSEWLMSSIIGVLIGYFYTGNFLLGLIITIIVSLIIFVAFIITNHFDEKYDILKILKTEIDAGNYPTVIQIGYTLSRPLHLSGRYAMREAVGSLTLSACRKMDATRKIRINDTRVSVKYIEAITLIDDLGWNVHLLGQSDVAVENIEMGIESAKSLNEFDLIIKGYRHILGICNATNRKEKREESEAAARTILEHQAYKQTFANVSLYNHAVAEFDYAYARSIIDEAPDRAMEIALRVRDVFSAEQTDDMDRYCKTFDLIADIFAYSENPEKLRKARSMYVKGIDVCKHHGRSERLIRMAIDYIDLLLKMIRVCRNAYDYTSWERQLDKEEKTIYEKARVCAERIENKKLFQQLRQRHKDYIRNRKRMRKEH